MISWDRSVIAAAPLRSKLLGPSFMDGRHPWRPGHAFKLNPNSGPVCPACDIGVALFGGLFCICEWPISASTGIKVLAPFHPFGWRMVPLEF